MLCTFLLPGREAGCMLKASGRDEELGTAALPKGLSRAAFVLLLSRLGS